MCELVGLGIGLFFVLIGGIFLYLNYKDSPKYFRFFSVISFEAGAVLLGILIILLSVLSLLGVGSGSCESIFE